MLSLLIGHILIFRFASMFSRASEMLSNLISMFSQIGININKLKYFSAILLF
jgi:hypothetical protein